MLYLTCPYCEIEVDETELSGGGEAHIKRAATDAGDDEFEGYLFLRKNPKGIHFERWRHTFGCGKWFHAARCTVSMEVFGTYDAQTTEPPEHVIKAIESRRPEVNRK